MFQSLTKLDYLLRETMRGLRRGGWMNWAAISTVTVLLFLFGFSLQASWKVDSLLNQFGSQLEVSVYLETGVSADVLKPAIEKLPGVAQVTTQSKEQAWANLVSELGISDIQNATTQLNGNPLVDEMRVRANNSKQVSTLAEQLRKMGGVGHVQYVDEAVRQLAELNQGLNWMSLIITIILTLTAIAVITTTIRLIVMARRREIEIMQLVGATNVWIYMPFILQGVTFGVVGAALAWGLLTGAEKFLVSFVESQPTFVQFVIHGMALDRRELILLPIILLGFGAGVGVMGSLFAVRRFAAK